MKSIPKALVKDSSLDDEQKIFSEKITNLCLLYLHYLRWTKKYSRHTLKSYSLDLRQFFLLKQNFEKEKGFLPKVTKRKKELEQKVKKAIETFLQKNRKLSSASQNRKLATAKSFIKWLFENDYIKEDFRFFFKSPKLSSKIPNILSVEEIFQTLDHLKSSKKNPEEVKMTFCLFYLLYGGGLRVSEACHLKVDDIHWQEGILRIKGKGGKERQVVLPLEAFRYLILFKKNTVYIFGNKPLSERKAYDLIRNCGKEAGLLKPLHPHVLRHSFATHLLTRGSNLRTLQELLGHKTLTATQKYLHLDLMHLSQILEKHHPINQKNSKNINNQKQSKWMKPSGA